MLTDLEARVVLKELIEKYLKGKDPEYVRLIETVRNPSRQVPIRGVLVDIRKVIGKQNHTSITEAQNNKKKKKETNNKNKNKSM